LDTYFDTEVSDLDFIDNLNAAETINDWAAENTNNKINNIVQPSTFTDETLAVLANATYFLGEWINGFHKSNTETKTFYTRTDGSTSVQCDMMLGGSLEDPFIMDYYCDNDIQILNIPF
jgi:serpin B